MSPWAALVSIVAVVEMWSTAHSKSMRNGHRISSLVRAARCLTKRSRCGIWPLNRSKRAGVSPASGSGDGTDVRHDTFLGGVMASLEAPRIGERS